MTGFPAACLLSDNILIEGRSACIICAKVPSGRQKSRKWQRLQAPVAQRLTPSGLVGSLQTGRQRGSFACCNVPFRLVKASLPLRKRMPFGRQVVPFGMPGSRFRRFETLFRAFRNARTRFPEAGVLSIIIIIFNTAFGPSLRPAGLLRLARRRCPGMAGVLIRVGGNDRFSAVFILNYHSGIVECRKYFVTLWHQFKSNGYGKRN